MGDVIDFTGSNECVYDRLCGECGCALFTWHTSEQNSDCHVLVCSDCETTYGIAGEELED